MKQADKPELNLCYFDLNPSFCYNECLNYTRNTLQVLRLPAMTGRPKIGKTNRTVQTTY